MRTISYKLDDLKKVVIPIGYEGENNHTRVIIDAGEVFKQYPEAAVALTVQPPKGTMYPAIVTRDVDTVTWDVKDSDCASNGNGEAQFTFTNGTVVVKSVVTKIKVQRSLHSEGPAPDPILSWLDNAEEVLDDLAAMDNIAKTAEAGDIGKALSPKTVENGIVTEWQYVEPGAGTEDYTDLENKPQIGGVELSGNKSLHDLGIAAESAIPDVSGKANLSVVAPAFDQATANDAGSLVTYTDGVVYVLPEGHTAGTTWANTQKTATNIAEQQRLLLTAIQGKIDEPETYGTSGQILSLDNNLDPVWVNPSTASITDGSVTQNKLNDELSSRMDIVKTIFDKDYSSLFEVGSRNTGSGEDVDSTTRMRTGYLDKGLTEVIPCRGYKCMLFAYKYDGTYVGAYNGTTFVVAGGSWETTPIIISALNSDYKYKLLAAKNDNSTINLSVDSKNIKLIWWTDKSVSVPGMAADANSTGNLLKEQFMLMKQVECISSFISKNKYTLTSDDFERGTRSYTVKADNSKRLRVGYMIPVKQKTVIKYSNPTLKLFIGLFDLQNEQIYASGWITGGSTGSVKANHIGSAVILVEGSEGIQPSDYDCEITISCDGFSDINDNYFYRTAEQTKIPTGNNAISYSDFITNTWEALRTAHSDVITRSVLTNDTSDTYPIYEYVIEPEYPKKTVLIAAGMHGDEYEGFWSLYRIFEFLFDTGYKHQKTRNLLHDTKFIIIPVLNPYGVQNRTRENSAGVNAHQNYDVRWDDQSYSRTGTTPFQYNEPKAVKLSLDSHNDVDLFIEFHTDRYNPEKGNYTEVIENSSIYPMAYNITLDERKYLNAEYDYYLPLSMDFVVMPTMQCNSIRYVEEVRDIPAILLEVGIGGEAQTGTEKQMNIAFDWYINCIIEAIKTLD